MMGVDTERPIFEHTQNCYLPAPHGKSSTAESVKNPILRSVPTEERRAWLRRIEYNRTQASDRLSSALHRLDDASHTCQTHEPEKKKAKKKAETI